MTRIVKQGLRVNVTLQGTMNKNENGNSQNLIGEVTFGFW